MQLRLVLYAATASLGLSILLYLVYEGLAPHFNQPFISDIVIPWVKAHNLVASLIGASVVWLIAFFALHFFGER